ncbi:uncharacterized protein RCC_01994 [Ramularia collo-cygni]|uniref:Uncharacterized protein n=1 Tax=Ramularia collo-cygni TaxID=112498 RepID=A0A2D3V728_9PEZI|nr:uncharacterized protein RCC_01994 [Ramularia collo-cygni]CZT16153.1 uncharacterized protein RCC_01994 [Ramularia collo-cygni]
MAVAHRVLNTAELVRHILLQGLSILDVMNGTIIDDSKALRRAQLLEPEVACVTIYCGWPQQDLTITKLHPSPQSGFIRDGSVLQLLS